MMTQLRAMISDHLLDDPRMHAAIEEFTSMISDRFPSASFSTYIGDDPLGVFLRTAVDIEDPDEVMDLVVDRLLAVQVEEDLPFYVLPTQTRERNEAIYIRDHARSNSSDASINDIVS